MSNFILDGKVYPITFKKDGLCTVAYVGGIFVAQLLDSNSRSGGWAAVCWTKMPKGCPTLVRGFNARWRALEYVLVNLDREHLLIKLRGERDKNDRKKVN